MQTNYQPDPALRRLRWLTGTIVLILVLWQFLPWTERYLIGMTSEPRAVTARGELAADEKATIEIFEHASPAHNLAVLRINVASTGRRPCR